MINFTCIHYINGEISLVKNGRGPRLPWTLKYVRVVVGVWKSGKSESGIGTGIGRGI